MSMGPIFDTARTVMATSALVVLVGLAVGCGVANQEEAPAQDVQAEMDTSLGSEEKYALHGLVLDQPETAPDFTMSDQHGSAYTLSHQRGRAVLLFFGYASCPDVCPLTLADLARVKQELGPSADSVEFIFVTVDPERDTLEEMKDYLSHFDPEFVGLRGGGRDSGERDVGLRGVRRPRLRTI